MTRAMPFFMQSRDRYGQVCLSQLVVATLLVGGALWAGSLAAGSAADAEPVVSATGEAFVSTAAICGGGVAPASTFAAGVASN